MQVTLVLVLFSIFTLKAHSQDSLQLFYINKVILSQSDSATIAQCTKIAYKGVSLEITLFNKNGNPETLYTQGQNYRWWKDSVLFSYVVPAALYNESDSVSIHPTFQIACSGLNGNRGVENVEAEGRETAVKNIRVKFTSNPPGATVYLIPKLIWERTPALSKSRSQAALSRYVVYNGITPVQATAQEYVYIALFKYKNRFVPVECSPTHFNTDDTVFANFEQ